MSIGQIGVGFVQKANAWVKASGKASILQTKPNVGFNFKDLKYLPFKDKNPTTDVAYHGSPFSFDFFDASKFGSGEGINKYGKGLYISRSKKLTPFYANIRSKDAPLHFGSTKKIDNPQPTVYTISGLNNMQFKQVSPTEAKNIAANQNIFETTHPNIDGLELDNQIIVFARSLDKLKIIKKQDLLDFIKENKGYPFRKWTTDESKLNI